MSNIYFTSDSHYFHKNICIGVSEWEDKTKFCRNFQTVEEMNDTIVQSINNVVKEDDILYHLGDWSFGGIENIWKFRKRINCKTIYLVCGNHDNAIKKNKELPNCTFEELNAFMCGKDYLDFNIGYNPYLSVDASDLFTEILPQCHKLKIGKTTLILSHYPIEEWEDMGHGSLMIHGHSHHTKDYTDLNMYYRRMDVGIDWEEFRPYSLDEVLKLKERKIYESYS